MSDNQIQKKLLEWAESLRDGSYDEPYVNVTPGDPVIRIDGLVDLEKHLKPLLAKVWKEGHRAGFDITLTGQPQRNPYE